ncbi:MAG: ABC transporter ATP-binding protein [Armatimonadetes bacterium]|nr:ABC transporter ATP-binding protein [Armatimonadota bacterium]
MSIGGAMRKTLDLLPASSRLQLCGLILLMLLSAVADVAGIAGWYPFVAFVTDPEAAKSRYWVQRLYDGLGFPSDTSFAVFLALSVLSLFLVANGIRALTAWQTYRLAWSERHRLSSALMSRYLSRPYVWYLDRNTAELLGNLGVETQHMVKCLLAQCTLISKGILVLLVSIGLLILDIRVALTSAVVLATIYLLVYVRFRARLTRLGAERMKEVRQGHQVAMEAFAAIKEAKVPPDLEEFLRRFRDHSRRHNQLMALSEIVEDVPSYLTEMLSVGAILTAAIYFVLTDRAEAISLVTIYIVATLRLAPALHKLYRTFIQIRFHLPSLEMVHRELQGDAGEVPGAIDELLELKSGISLRQASLTYPNAQTAAIQDVTLHIPKDRTLALVGQTGAGKTTIADVVAGLLIPQEGRLEVDGVPLDLSRSFAWRRNVGYVPQEIFLLDDTVRRNIAFGVPDHSVDDEAVVRVAQTASIHDFIVNELEQGYDTVLGERGISLSGGQRQRIGIARALYRDPQVLIFDEATSSLDGLTEQAVLQALQTLAHRKTMLVIAHRLSTVKHCDDICLVAAGRVKAQGSFEGLMASEPAFAALAHFQPVEEHSRL